MGLCWASAGSYTLSDEGVMATVHVLAVDTEKLGPMRRVKTFKALIAAIKKWSETRGAEHVLVHVTTGMDMKVADRLLRGGGARVVGGGYLV